MQANLPQSVLARWGMFLFEYIKVNKKESALSEIGGCTASTLIEQALWAIPTNSLQISQVWVWLKSIHIRLRSLRVFKSYPFYFTLMILAIFSVTLGPPGRNSNYQTRAPDEGFKQETDWSRRRQPTCARTKGRKAHHRPPLCVASEFQSTKGSLRDLSLSRHC